MMPLKRAGWLAAATVAAVMGWHYWPRERLLWAHSRRAIPADLGSVSLSGGAWPGGDRALACKLDQYREFDRPVSLDIATGAVAPLEPLNRALRRQRRTDTVPIRECFSPDGRWFLHLQMKETGTRRGVVTAIDGSRTITFPWYDPEGPDDLFWHPDCRGWTSATYCAKGGNVVRRHRLDRPGAVEVVRLPPLTLYATPAGETRDGRILYADWVFKREGESIPLWLVRPDHGRPAIESHVIAPPLRGNVMHLRMAPGGDRLAWRVEEKLRPSVPSVLERPLSRLGFRERHLMALWISGPDGSGMQELGHLPYQAMLGQVELWRTDGHELLVDDVDWMRRVPVDPDI